MLRELKVENLALIESLHLSFDRADDASLVVLTGETGAGKSIMMRAIDLLSGGRGSADWVRSGAETCTVEALFDVGAHFTDVHELLRDGGFEDSDQVLCKRVINSEGRSRFYINGSMATARLVSEISFRLFSIASQHDHQRLLQPALHLDFLDILGDHQKQREQVRSRHEAWRAAQQELARLQDQNREREQRRDFLAYQIREISDIAPEPDEDERLGIERKRLKNGEALIRLSRECHELLEESICENLAVVRKHMEQLRQLDPDVETLADELSSYSYLAEDFSARLRDYFDTLDDDPARLDAISARLDRLQGLKRKYGETLTDVLNYLAAARLELEALDNLDQQIEAQRKKTRQLEQEVLDRAEQLSTARRKTASAMEQAMARELLSLSFEQSAIEVRFQPVDDKLAQMRAVGFDRVEFFFAPNPGEPSRPLARVASGGELSRLMLAFKCLLARKDMVETVIFDEVDAGIGGQAAESVARKIRELAGHHQVICITHLPQIAARGTHHFLVEKGRSGGRTVTSVVMLSEQQRVEELARMLAGESPSVQTEAWARELLAKGKRAA